MILLLLLSFLLNGNFSQGFDHWQPVTGWSIENNIAVLTLDNRYGKIPVGSVMCSDPYSIQGKTTLVGSAKIYEQNFHGYVHPGVRWFNSSQQRMGDYAFGYDRRVKNAWVTVPFETEIPEGAEYAAFCFFGGVYEKQFYQARADDANLGQ